MRGAGAQQREKNGCYHAQSWVSNLKDKRRRHGGGACPVGEGMHETESGLGGAGGSGIDGGGAAALRCREKSANAMACWCRKAMPSTEVSLRSVGTCASTTSVK